VNYLKVLFLHLPGRTEQNHDKPQDSLGRELDPGLPEYEAGVLPLSYNVRSQGEEHDFNDCGSAHSGLVKTRIL
jgi:hypothetical protein